MSKLKCVLLDADGTFRPPPVAGKVMGPFQGMAAPLRSLRKQGMILGAATGGSHSGIKANERSLGLRFDLVASSYATRVVRRGGHAPAEYFLGDPAQRASILEITPALDRIRTRHRGMLDDRGAVYTMFLVPGTDAFTRAAEEVARLIADVPGLKYVANPDGGLTIMPRDATKQLVVDHVHELGMEVVLAAGDGGTDAPLLEACWWPVVTRTSRGAPAHPQLVEIVRRKGRGYIAREDEPHGHGLLAGLLSAREAGALIF